MFNLFSIINRFRSNRRLLLRILANQETIMSATQTGLAALQAFAKQFQDFTTQMSTDLTALTTAINTAIANLSGSEDPAVQAVVTDLQGSLTTLQSVASNIEGLTQSLVTVETPAPAAAPAPGSTAPAQG